MSLIQTNVSFKDKRIPLDSRIEYFACGRYHLFIKTIDKLFVFGNNLYNQLGMATFDVEAAQEELRLLRDRHRKRNYSKDFLNPTFNNNPEVKQKELESLEQYFNASFHRNSDEDTDSSTSDDLSSPLSLVEEDESFLEAEFQFHFQALTEWTGPLEPRSISKIICGGFHTVFLVDEGAKVYVCGNNSSYQCGLQHCQPIDGLVRLEGIRIPIKHVACGEFHSIFCTYTNEIAVCGASGLGDLPDSNRLTFIKYSVFAGKNIKQISAGGGFSLILCEDGSLYGFGRSGQGQLGQMKIKLSAPTKIDLGEGFIPKAISCGYDHTLVLAESLKDSQQILFGGGAVTDYVLTEDASEGGINDSLISTPTLNRIIGRNAEYPSEYLGDDAPITPRKLDSSLELHSPSIGSLSPIAKPNLLGESLLPQNWLKMSSFPNHTFLQPIHVPLSRGERIVNIKSGEQIFVVETTKRLIPIGNGFQPTFTSSDTYGIELPLNHVIMQYGAMDNSILRIEAEKDWQVPKCINEYRLEYPNTCDLQIEFSCFDLELKRFARSEITKLPVSTVIPSLLSPTTEKMIKIAKKEKKSKKASKSKKGLKKVKKGKSGK